MPSARARPQHQHPSGRARCSRSTGQQRCTGARTRSPACLTRCASPPMKRSVFTLLHGKNAPVKPLVFLAAMAASACQRRTHVGCFTTRAAELQSRFKPDSITAQADHLDAPEQGPEVLATQAPRAPAQPKVHHAQPTRPTTSSQQSPDAFDGGKAHRFDTQQNPAAASTVACAAWQWSA